ncbi:7684_t:CDS:1, partial [Scutellospora calospora]
ALNHNKQKDQSRPYINTLTMYWAGLWSTLYFIVMSIGPFLSPTHTLDPVKQVGECKPSPALQVLIWKSSHCQNERTETTISPTNLAQSTIDSVFRKNNEKSEFSNS